MVQPSIN